MATIYRTIQVLLQLQLIDRINFDDGSDRFELKATGEGKYQLRNSIGQVVMSGSFDNETQINAEGLSQGVYFLHLTGKQGSMAEKIVIEK